MPTTYVIDMNSPAESCVNTLVTTLISCGSGKGWGEEERGNGGGEFEVKGIRGDLGACSR